jgi:NADPH2 dehydrogenase
MPKLLQPLELADCHLKHRMIMAPLTNFRANNDYVPMNMIQGMSTQAFIQPQLFQLSLRVLATN